MFKFLKISLMTFKRLVFPNFVESANDQDDWFATCFKMSSLLFLIALFYITFFTSVPLVFLNAILIALVFLFISFITPPAIYVLYLIYLETKEVKTHLKKIKTKIVETFNQIKEEQND